MTLSSLEFIKPEQNCFQTDGLFRLARIEVDLHLHVRRDHLHRSRQDIREAGSPENQIWRES